MTELTIAGMCAACGGVWQGDEALLQMCPTDVVTDSRKAKEGSLFIALRGERTDGHKYIKDVLAKGAMAVLCEEPGEKGEPRIVVPEVLTAMRQIAACTRQRFAYPFIGVTGSVGKTTAKEMIASVLSAKYKAYKTPGSMNGQIGIPVTLMTLSPEYEAAVIEMGISLPGEMIRIAHVVRPDHVVFTNIGDAHLEALHDRPGILREKSDILSDMEESGVVFANGDDTLLAANDFGRRTVLFGLGENCHVRAEDVRTEDGVILLCRIVAGDRDIPVRVPAYGNYMIYSVLAAAAVGLELGLSDEEIQDGLTRYNTVGHRSRVVKTALCTLIDDCYNANPTSNRAAIDSMENLPGRKVCILGDMREMGANSPDLHREIGRYALEHGISLVVTEGEQAKYISEAAGELGRHFPDRPSLLAGLSALIRPGDVVLVKASHGASFEDVAETIEKM